MSQHYRNVVDDVRENISHQHNLQCTFESRWCEIFRYCRARRPHSANNEL